MAKSFDTQKGFTLIELLASITILILVFTGFFTFFSNAASYTKTNSEDLQAMNLAKDIIEKTKEQKAIEGIHGKTAPYVIQLMDGKSIDRPLTLSKDTYRTLTQHEKKITDKLRGELGLKNDWTFDENLTTYENDSYVDNLQLKLTLTPTTVSKKSSKAYELIMITVSIYESNATLTSDRPLSETYGYVPVGGK